MPLSRKLYSNPHIKYGKGGVSIYIIINVGMITTKKRIEKNDSSKGLIVCVEYFTVTLTIP